MLKINDSFKPLDTTGKFQQVSTFNINKGDTAFFNYDKCKMTNQKKEKLHMLKCTSKTTGII